MGACMGPITGCNLDQIYMHEEIKDPLGVAYHMQGYIRTASKYSNCALLRVET